MPSLARDNGVVSTPDTGLRLLAVHAHPDDESSKGAASMARYLSEGVRVMVATCTGGERGDVLNPALKSREAEIMARLPLVRRREMAAAQAILGVEHEWLGFIDSGLPRAPEGSDVVPPLAPWSFGGLALEIASAPLVELVRRFRPHVVTTYDEEGGYPHPDHVMTHRVSMEAWEKAGDPTAYPGLGEPWTPSKLYYHQTFSKPRLTALHDALTSAGLESHYGKWLEEWVDRPEHANLLTTQVECGEFFPIRDEALKAHATQIDPDGAWFQMSHELQVAAWPTEDYTLARSRVESAIPETDLFAGLRVSSRVAVTA